MKEKSNSSILYTSYSPNIERLLSTNIFRVLAPHNDISFLTFSGR